MTGKTLIPTIDSLDPFDVALADLSHKLMPWLKRPWSSAPSRPPRLHHCPVARLLKIIMEHVVEAGVDEHKPKPAGRPRNAKTEAEKLAQAARTRIANALSHKKRRDAEGQRECEIGIVRRKRGHLSKHKGNEDASPDC